MASIKLPSLEEVWLWKLVLQDWVDNIEDLCHVDTAICNGNSRKHLLLCLRDLHLSKLSFDFNSKEMARACTNWLLSRGIKVYSICDFHPMESDEWRECIPDILPVFVNVRKIEIYGFCFLQEIDLEETLKDIETLLLSCSNLDTFSTRLQYDLTQIYTAIEPIFLSNLSHHGALTSLELKMQASCDVLTVDSITQHHFHNLRALTLHTCKLSDREIVQILETLKFLRTLYLKQTEEAAITSLGKEEQWPSLPKFENLCCLQIVREQDDRNKSSSRLPLHIIHRSPILREMSISGGRFEPIPFNRLPTLCPHLKKIKADSKHLVIEVNNYDQELDCEDPTRPENDSQLRLSDIEVHHISSDIEVHAILRHQSPVRCILTCANNYNLPLNRLDIAQIQSFKDLRCMILHRCIFSKDIMIMLWSVPRLQVMELRLFSISEDEWYEAIDYLLQKSIELHNLQKLTLQPLNDVSATHSLTHGMIQWICFSARNLQQLQIYHFFIDDAKLNQLLSALPLLIHISLNGRDSKLNLITPSNPETPSRLRSLSLHEDQNINIDHLKQFLSHNPRITSVCLFKCDNFDPQNTEVQQFIQEQAQLHRDISCT